MELNQLSDLGAALGSIGLGLAALPSWLHLRVVIHQWEKAVCTLQKAEEKAEEAASFNDGDKYRPLRLTFDTPRGAKVSMSAPYVDAAAFNIQEVHYAPGDPALGLYQPQAQGRLSVAALEARIFQLFPHFSALASRGQRSWFESDMGIPVMQPFKQMSESKRPLAND